MAQPAMHARRAPPRRTGPRKFDACTVYRKGKGVVKAGPIDAYPRKAVPYISGAMPKLPRDSDKDEDGQLRYRIYNVPARWAQSGDKQLCRSLKCTSVARKKPMTHRSDRILVVVIYRSALEAERSLKTLCSLLLSPKKGDYIKAMRETAQPSAVCSSGRRPQKRRREDISRIRSTQNAPSPTKRSRNFESEPDVLIPHEMQPCPLALFQKRATEMLLESSEETESAPELSAGREDRRTRHGRQRANSDSNTENGNCDDGDVWVSQHGIPVVDFDTDTPFVDSEDSDARR